MHYQEALRFNCENYEAFNRLISNYLLTKEEKKKLINELKFTPENLWLKDYYISRIDQILRPASDIEGYMVIKNANTTSIHNNMGDESGLSPSRFQPDLENEDPNDTLRNPRSSSQTPL